MTTAPTSPPASAAKESRATLDAVRQSEAARREHADDMLVDRLLQSLGDPAKADRSARAVVEALRHRPAPPLSRRFDSLGDRMHLTRTVTALAATVLVVVTLGWLARQMTLHPAATLDPMGTVIVKRGDRVIAATRATRLYAGDTLLTGPGGLALVRYTDDTSFLRLRPNSTLIFGRQNARSLTLEDGALLAGASRAGNRPMNVATPHAALAAQGSRFRLAANERFSSLEVTDGTVTVTRPADPLPVEVQAGYVMDLKPAMAPSLQAIDPVVVSQVRADQLADFAANLTFARALAVNTLAYPVSLDGSRPPESLKAAIAAAHQAGVRFFARIDTAALRAADGDETLRRKTQEWLVSVIREYDFDGLYLSQGSDPRTDVPLATILTPILQHMEQQAPGTDLLVGVLPDHSS